MKMQTKQLINKKITALTFSPNKDIVALEDGTCLLGCIDRSDKDVEETLEVINETIVGVDSEVNFKSPLNGFIKLVTSHTSIRLFNPSYDIIQQKQNT